MKLIWQDQTATSRLLRVKSDETESLSKHSRGLSLEDLWADSSQFLAGPRFLLPGDSEDDNFCTSIGQLQNISPLSSVLSSGSLGMAFTEDEIRNHPKDCASPVVPPLVPLCSEKSGFSECTCPHGTCEFHCSSDLLVKLDRPSGWMLDPKSVQVGPQFAHGMSGRLYRGLYNGDSVAVKILREPATADEAIFLANLFDVELSALRRLYHKNVVKLIGACEKGDLRGIVTEYVPGGSLRDYLQKQDMPLPHNRVVDMAIDIARGMAHVHSCGLVMRDLKSENVLVSDNGSLKICDFGSSKAVDGVGDMTGETGTYRWMAPEVMGAKGYSHKSDVYSFGIVLWEMCTRKLPYGDLTPLQAAFAVYKKSARPPLPKGGHMPLIRLMQQCWQSDPKWRPEFSHIIQMLENIKGMSLRGGYEHGRTGWVASMCGTRLGERLEVWEQGGVQI